MSCAVGAKVWCEVQQLRPTHGCECGMVCTGGTTGGYGLWKCTGATALTWVEVALKCWPLGPQPAPALPWVRGLVVAAASGCQSPGCSLWFQEESPWALPVGKTCCGAGVGSGLCWGPGG